MPYKSPICFATAWNLPKTSQTLHNIYGCESFQTLHQIRAHTSSHKSFSALWKLRDSSANRKSECPSWFIYFIIYIYLFILEAKILARAGGAMQWQANDDARKTEKYKQCMKRMQPIAPLQSNLNARLSTVPTTKRTVELKLHVDEKRCAKTQSGTKHNKMQEISHKNEKIVTNTA